MSLRIELDSYRDGFLADCEYDSPTSYLPNISFFLFSSSFSIYANFLFPFEVPDLYSLSCMHTNIDFMSSDDTSFRKVTLCFLGYCGGRFWCVFWSLQNILKFDPFVQEAHHVNNVCTATTKEYVSG